MSSEGTRPPVHSPEFKPYFEGVIESSKGLLEAMQRMGYGGPSSVRYHMKRLGIKSPDHWYGHPTAYGPEFAPYFKNIVNTSKTVGEAVHRLGYANPSVIRHHLRRLGLEAPLQWRLKPGVSRQRRGRVPEVILQTEHDRAWVAALTQGEGCIKTHYSKKQNSTSLELCIAMTDSAPVFKFCDLCGVKRPKNPTPRLMPWKPIWIAVIGGLRAYRVMQEILSFLTGQKLNEAKKALEFFSPGGYRRGRYGGYDVWPDNGFPLRKRGLSRYAQSLNAKFTDSGEGLAPLRGANRASLRLDRSCLRIADVLLDAPPDGQGLVEIMDRSRLSWTAVIHHLKHLKDNSLVMKEKIRQRLGGPRLLYKAHTKLAELRERGWIPDPDGGSPGKASRPASSP